MKKLIAILVLGFTLIGCEIMIGDINEWWSKDVLEHEEETATVTIELDWSEE